MKTKERETYDLRQLTVLALLAERPMHPYEMQRLIRERHKEFALGTTRSLYHAVERLAREQLIEPMETSREGNRPERTTFGITEAGRDELVIWLTDLLSTTGPEDPQFTAAISLLPILPVETALHALRLRALGLEGRVAELATQLRLLSDQLPRVFLLETEYAHTIRERELAWVRALIEDIQRGAVSWPDPNLSGPNLNEEEPS
jgi:DNA-binding PadR family transcriptional regulator